MKKQHYLLLALLMLITFFANRAALPTDIMEARNLVTAREIVADGNWLVPTMNGEPRLEKPPLPTWVAAAIEKMCPGNLAAQRTAPGLMGCLWTVYLFLLVRYLLPSLAPCSIAVACLIVNFKQGEQMDRVSKWLYVANGLLITVIVLAVPALAYHFGVKQGMIGLPTLAVVSVAIGTYDDNKHPKRNRHYTSDFINHVTLLKLKK